MLFLFRLLRLESATCLCCINQSIPQPEAGLLYIMLLRIGGFHLQFSMMSTTWKPNLKPFPTPQNHMSLIFYVHHDAISELLNNCFNKVAWWELFSWDSEPN